MDKYQSIRLFIRSARLGSFTATADEQNLTQSAVSKKIAWLEQNVGFRLFHRNNRRIQLTQQGKVYLNYCERMLEEMNHTESSLKKERHDVSGELKLSLPSAMATELLAEPISTFMSLHPLASIHVSVSDRKADLVEEDVDIAIRAAVLEDSGYKARFIFNNQAICFAARSWLEQNGKPEQAEDLANHACLCYSLITPSDVWQLQKPGDEPVRVKVRQRFKSDSPEMLLKMARLGQGIAMLPEWMARPWLESGELVQILEQYQMKALPMYAVYKADEYQPMRIRAFIDHLVAHFEKQPPALKI